MFGAFRITEVTTDADGVARWGWVPKECAGNVQVYAAEDLDAVEAVGLSHFAVGDATLTVLLRRKARLSGRVVHDDGSPAPGVTVRSVGFGKEGDSRGGEATTGADGSYTMLVPPYHSHLIAATAPDGAAKPLTDTNVGEGEAHGGLDFRLIAGTRLHGRAAFRPGDPRLVQVALMGEERPASQQSTPGARERVHLLLPVTLDAEGRYEVRLGPGEYRVTAAHHRQQHMIHVDGTGEAVVDFLDDFIPPPLTLTGVVVEPAPGGGERPAKASVMVRTGEGHSFNVRSDAAGHFSIQRPDQDVGLYARGENGIVAAVRVAKGSNEVKVVLAPGVTASGRVVDASGKPMVGQGPSLGMIAGPGDVPRNANSLSLSKFEAGGRYEFTGLHPGAEYRAHFVVVRDSGARESFPIKTFRVSGPGPIDLGEFVVPAAKP